MPRRADLASVLIIGSGPIAIGQACEFDYSGTQAVKALREDGVRVVLINSNPATIMTDPDLADATYIEPLTVEVLDRVMAAERPSAVLPTLGGQTSLNLVLAAHEAGVLARHGVELIGASIASITMAEDREQFKAAMTRIGVHCPRSRLITNLGEARAAAGEVGFPAVLRPSFTLGGSGGGIAHDPAELDRMVAFALDQSPVRSALVEESVLGWKEFELEVMRDAHDNCVVVCSIENLDPMGVHTGDSITVAPAMTLTDKEYQRMRDAAFAIMREIGVATGGSNVQFAIDPATGRMLAIEMNPRVSRSSALASKATGFPIAKLAAKLAIGYTLDELRNDITVVTPASFEPALDYVVIKCPRFAFEKFPGASRRLGPQMKSVGEAMAIGRTFREALGKAIRSLEAGRTGFDLARGPGDDLPAIEHALATPDPERLFQLGRGFQLGLSLERAHALTRIDPWFLHQIRDVACAELALAGAALGTLASGGDLALPGGDAAGPHGLDVVRGDLRRWKRLGLSDRRIATLVGASEDEVRAARLAAGIRPAYKRVDTCAAELAAQTPYLYSTYDDECEAQPTARPKVMILGGGPNRIGQGIEFDYCCVHAAMALAEEGVESIMVNSNPETVSTDYDTSDRLYFEPVTLEDVLAIYQLERPLGVLVGFGGQTPLNLAGPLAAAGVPLLGTTADAIDRAEDRQRFGELLRTLGLCAPAWGTARSLDEARRVARDLGFPIMVRPSYVLGGRAMERVDDDDGLAAYFARLTSTAGLPLLLDQFLVDAIEVDVDVVTDRTGAVMIGGVLEHIEPAGIHSGDSACALPPYSLDAGMVAEVARQARALAAALAVVGLVNVQLAVHRGSVYVLEVNPRASRTVPFVSKATGVPLAKIAVKAMLGKTLAELGVVEVTPSHVAVKEVVFPFLKFDGVDPRLGPEMRSTGEAMGLGADFARAFAKSQLAAGVRLPARGRVVLDAGDQDRPAAAELARRLIALGFTVVATGDTAAYLDEAGVTVTAIAGPQGFGPTCIDALDARAIDLVIAIASSVRATAEAALLRRAALRNGIALVTTRRGADATVDAIAACAHEPLEVRSLQRYLAGA